MAAHLAQLQSQQLCGLLAGGPAQGSPPFVHRQHGAVPVSSNHVAILGSLPNCTNRNLAAFCTTANATLQSACNLLCPKKRSTWTTQGPCMGHQYLLGSATGLGCLRPSLQPGMITPCTYPCVSLDVIQLPPPPGVVTHIQIPSKIVSNMKPVMSYSASRQTKTLDHAWHALAEKRAPL
jgi:hypothetical protein